MTTDLRPELERARSLAPAFPPDVDALIGARDRRARRRRVGAMTLSLAVGLLVIAGAFAVAGSRPGSVASGRDDFPIPTSLEMPPLSYLYMREVAFSGTDTGSPLETWWASDGSGRIMHPGVVATRRYGPGEMPTGTGSLDGLSLDAGTLREQMIARMQPDGASPEPFDEFTPGPGQSDHVTAGLIRSIGELLGAPNTTPELRAALFRVAAGLEGVTVTRDAVDPTGRAAIELQVITEGSLHHWWFDPDTQQLMAAQEDDGPVTVVESEAFVSGTGMRNEIPSLVPAPLHRPR